MRSRYQVVLNDVSLAEISPKIIILDVNHEAPEFRRTSSQLANRNGLFIGNDQTVSGASVSVTFEIHEYSISKRQEICQSVVAWAINGGVFQVNDRPNQRLICKCDKLPAVESVQKWTEEFTVVFTGYEHPLWEDLYPSTAVLSGTSGNGSLYAPGNGMTSFVEVTVTPVSTVQNITLTVGNTSITLNGCGATTTEPIKISYDDLGFQSIKRGDVSIMDKRTGASSDDLVAQCGKPNDISFSASASVSVTFSVRGVWL